MTQHKDYDKIIDELVAFWVNRPHPTLERELFYDATVQALSWAMEEIEELEDNED